MEVNVAAEFDNIETIKQAVDEGAGIAVLPEPTLQREVQRRTLVQARFILPQGEPQLVRPLSIVHRRNRRLNPTVKAFITLLQNGKASAPTQPVHSRTTSGPRPLAGEGRTSEGARTRPSTNATGEATL